jgi:hypothetical protein
MQGLGGGGDRRRQNRHQRRPRIRRPPHARAHWRLRTQEKPMKTKTKLRAGATRIKYGPVITVKPKG